MTRRSMMRAETESQSAVAESISSKEEKMKLLLEKYKIQDAPQFLQELREIIRIPKFTGISGQAKEAAVATTSHETTQSSTQKKSKSASVGAEVEDPKQDGQVVVMKAKATRQPAKKSKVTAMKAIEVVSEVPESSKNLKEIPAAESTEKTAPQPKDDNALEADVESSSGFKVTMEKVDSQPVKGTKRAADRSQAVLEKQVSQPPEKRAKRAVTADPSRAPEKDSQPAKKVKRPATADASRGAEKQVSQSTKKPKKFEDPHFPGRDALDLVEKDLQKHLDTLSNNLKGKFRFEIGDGALCNAHGYFYECEIINRDAAQALPSGLDEGALREAGPFPVYSVRFKGWGQKYDALVPENHLIARRFGNGTPSFEDAFGMLYADQWNYKRMTANALTAKNLGKGSWFLNKELRSKFEQIWQNKTNVKQNFREYCRRPLSK